MTTQETDLSQRPGSAEYVVVGAGCAGLTLAWQLSQQTRHPVVIVDNGAPRPDHFFGFWDHGAPALSLARDLATARWNRWSIITDQGVVVQNSTRSPYTALSSQAYETRLLQGLKGCSRIRFVQASANQVACTPELCRVDTTEGRIHGGQVFDSRPLPTPPGTLLQHFLGWRVQCEAPCFEPETAILMDFRVSQSRGMHFIYLLPFSQDEALVESTVFSPDPLPECWYADQIRAYLSEWYGIHSFRTVAREQGQIPLLYAYDRDTGRGTPVGVRAGAVRVSSGYAFAHILTQAEAVALDVARRRPVTARPCTGSVDRWMDHVLLRVIRRNPHLAPRIFQGMAAALSGDEMADFMNGNHGWRQRLRIVAAMPAWPFVRACLA